MRFTTDDELDELDERLAYLRRYNIFLSEGPDTDKCPRGCGMFYWYDNNEGFKFGPYPTALGALLGAEAYIKDTYETKR